MLLFIWYLLIFVFGLAAGSFLTAYTWRWPRGISIAKGRSICDNCKKKISLRYPLIELSTGVLFVLTITLLGGFGRLGELGFLLTAYYLLLAAVLIAIFIIDLENQLIPDGLVFLIFTLNVSLLVLSSDKNFYQIMFTGFLSAFFFLFLNLVTRGRGMGLGDAKLVLALSPILGYPQTIAWIFLRFIIGGAV